MFHGAKCYLLQEDDGQITPAHSISAGLDYPGVGPEHSFYKATGRADYVSVTDKESVEGFKLLSEAEGIIPALEARSRDGLQSANSHRQSIETKPSSSVSLDVEIKMCTPSPKCLA